MQVKKYEAPTVQEALDTIKRELGPEAIILKTKQHKRGFGLMSKGSVEVTVAVSERSLSKKKVTENRLTEESVNELQRLPADKQADLYEELLEKQISSVSSKEKMQNQTQKQDQASKKITATRYIDIDDTEETKRLSNKGQQAMDTYQATRSDTSRMVRNNKSKVEEEVDQLKRLIAEMKTEMDEKSALSNSGVQSLMRQPALSTSALQNAYQQLVVAGVESRFALELVQNISFTLPEAQLDDLDTVLDQLTLDLIENIHTENFFSTIQPRTEGNDIGAPILIALVGPTGVGKTTTVAKIASNAVNEKKLRVGMINVDNYKVAAFDQVATYAKILNLPFRSVANELELKHAVSDFKNLDLVILDTTGRSQKEVESLIEMQKLIHSQSNVKTYLTLSVAIRDAELHEMGKKFGIFRPEGLIFSKLDEALSYGSIYNLSHRLKLPVHYFTTGQKVPDDLESATPERLAALILDIR